MPKGDQERLDAIYRVLKRGDAASKKRIADAYLFAKKAHRGQKRLSGEAYISHPYETALYLARIGMGPKTVAAGLLHDVLEDTAVTTKELEDNFGKEITFLVQGVTKLGTLKYQGLKRHAESLRKLLIAMTEDVRVLIIKLADRLHNMETISALPKDSQKRIALETLEIYAPLAHRLGIGKMRGMLEDLAFPIVYPKEYRDTQAFIKEETPKNLERLEKVSKTLKKKVAEIGIRDIRTDYRVKHLYSTWKKLLAHDMNSQRVYDIAALRIIVPSIPECYQVLGIVHNTWRPVPNRVKDYIASPKSNGYRSLHTTIFTGDGGIVEIQIRTQEMHDEAEHGIASHIVYKEGADQTPLLSRAFRMLSLRGTAEDEESGHESPPWLRELVELHKDSPAHELLHDLKKDFFGNRVFISTPKGEVIDLPEGATPIDFAYAIHSDIGNHMSGALVNGRLVAIDTPLKNGDIVEIKTTKKLTPTRKWLEQAKTTLAKRRVRSLLQKNKG